MSVPKRHILIADDEINILHTLKMNLELEGYEVLTADNGEEAFSIFRQCPVDLVILDVMMPVLDGFGAAKKIKRLNPDIPILFLTAKSSSQDKIEGLKLGADDYLTKPFNLEELLLRIQILLKRYAKPLVANYQLNQREINYLTYSVRMPDGSDQSISGREMQLLKWLIEKENEVISRDEILERLWTPDENPSSRTIDNFIANFRKLFEENSKDPKYFHSIRGVGYKFTSGRSKE